VHSIDQRRPDIDLLRAFAVMSVLLYHFDVPGLSGGFLGVDIFFVISGFLITSHIVQQLQSETFSFSSFYAKRIRRLAPALAVCMLFTSVASLLILPRELLLDFAKSQLASTLYLSNVYFWSVADYFDTGSYLKPLLHTWSLSVEEQFYAIWPVFLVVLRFRGLYWFILIAGGLSLLAAEMIHGMSTATTFYMFPFRIFEFAIGALVNAVPAQTKHRYTDRAIIWLCIAFLVGSIALLSESDRLPGFLNLPICLATAIIIWVNYAHIRTDALWIKLTLRVGLISYSAYLIHWPLVVFYKIVVVEQLRWFDALFLITATLVLAELSYRYVEQTFARMKPKARPSQLFTLLALLTVFAGAYLWAAPRIYEALSADGTSVQAVIDNTPLRKGHIDRIQANESFPTKINAPFQILVVGDSHAVDIALALSWALSEHDIGIALRKRFCEPLTLNSLGASLDQLYQTHSNANLSPEKCKPVHARLIKEIEAASPDLVVISDQWRKEAVPYLTQTVAEIKSKTAAEVLVLGPNFELRGNPRILLRDIDNVADIDEIAWERRRKDREQVDQLVQAASQAVPTAFISKLDIVCPEARCDILLGDQLSYADGNHWTVEGMKLFGRRLVRHPTFIKLIEPDE